MRDRPLLIARRAALAVALGSLQPPVRRAVAASPEITGRVRLSIVVGDAPAQYVSIGLYGNAAPGSVATFTGLCAGNLEKAPGLSYAGSSVTKIVRESNYILGGRLAGGDAQDVERSIDSTGYVRSETVSKADRFANSDANTLSHDRPGLVSMKRGGKSFEFLITTAANRALDAENVVIGEVEEGQPLIDELISIPVRRPSAQSDLSGYASFLAIKAGVGLTGAGVVGRIPLGDERVVLAGRLGLGLLAAAFVGGDDPRIRSRELAYRPLTKVRILSSKVVS